jgi:alkylmercury lyase
MTISTQLRDLADAIGAAAPGTSDQDRRVAVAVYELLTDGSAVTAAAAAARAGVDQRAVDERLDAWPGVFRDEQGRMTGFWGLALAEMDHRFRAEGGKPIYAWCALDPFLVVPVISRPARTVSQDPVTGETITMTVTPDGIRDLSPATAVTTLLQPDGPFGHDVVESFCHYVLNFASRQSAERWAAGRQDIVVLPVADAFEVGLRAWARLRIPGTGETAQRDERQGAA